MYVCMYNILWEPLKTDCGADLQEAELDLAEERLRLGWPGASFGIWLRAA